MLEPSRDFLPTGYEPFDAEHARLSESIERLLAELNKGRVAAVRSTLSDLLSLTEEHFAHEERLMADTGYAQYPRHKEAHDLFVGDLRTFSREVETHGLSPTFRRWAVGRLPTWARFHVSANDVALGAHLAARRRQGRASSAAELADAAVER
jgi:hemerythrin-like metal-binding protein